MPGQRVPHRFRRALKARAALALQRTSPELWVAVNRRWLPLPTDIGPETELLIEGFEGSGNTYARAWIHFANGDRRIASHHHGPGAISYAIRHGIPTLVLAREPVAAIASVMTRFPEARDPVTGGPERLLHRYVAVYEPALEHPLSVVVALFKPDDPEWLVPATTELNRRWNCGFATLAREHEHLVEEYLATKDRDPNMAALPNEARDELNVSIRSEIGSRRHAASLQRAQATYERLATRAAASHS